VKSFFALIALLLPVMAFASGVEGERLDLTHHWAGYAALILFIVGYILVIGEEFLHLRKSKPMMVVAGVIWAMVAFAYSSLGSEAQTYIPEEQFRHNLLEYAELFLFLLAAMTFVNVMEERRVFEALRAWLVSLGLSFRGVFWVTGLLAFAISPVADNLTTALLMAAVVMAVGGSNHAFVVPSLINIVVAANAGGAFSPFGDITTLMVWQKGLVQFGEFINIFVPSLVNWLVPAAIMVMAVPSQKPTASEEVVKIKPGGLVVIGLFLFTIIMAVSSHNFLHMPAVLGMMTGLGLLKLYSYFIKRAEMRKLHSNGEVTGPEGPEGVAMETVEQGHDGKHFDIFGVLARAEWDTLMFFYGVVLAVGGLGTIGYLALASSSMYGGLGATWANVVVGLLSAVVDNIPVMFAVLTMNPDMSLGQWLLVTLTAGVGGSLLSVGSAAGVALMGQARGVYTFFSHLKWSWAIALGYVASVATHLWLNASLF